MKKKKCNSDQLFFFQVRALRLDLGQVWDLCLLCVFYLAGVCGAVGQIQRIHDEIQ